MLVLDHQDNISLNDLEYWASFVEDEMCTTWDTSRVIYEN